MPDASRLALAVRRHPRLWGAALSLLILALYVTALRPARLWVAGHVAYPTFAAVDTPRARSFTLARPPDRPDAVFAIPNDLVGGGTATEIIRADRGDRVAQWAAPVGVIFLLPAMFLAALFPDRPYWAYLLAYHVVLGVASFAVFAVGLGWLPPAFELYTFSRTYLAETVSFAVPVLLVFAARGRGPLARPRAA